MAKKKNYTIEDFEKGDAVKCEHCEKFMPRIQWTHLKYKCKTSITLEEYKNLYPNKPLVAKNLVSSMGLTKEKMIEKYGAEEGLIRWDSYRNKQAITNTFEYKHDKYGWTKEQFDEYNQSRAVTKENLINRHGEEKGLEVWNNYIEQQRYTCSKEYFIKEYGEDKGTKKYYNWNEQRLNTSALENEVIGILEKELGKQETQIEIPNNNFNFYFDFGSTKLKKLIEINGNVFHANPSIYNKDSYIPVKQMKAEEIWKHDEYKLNCAKEQGYDIYVIWENDWKNNKTLVIDNVVKWWNK